jgi:3-dehydroquinate dehydratase
VATGVVAGFGDVGYRLAIEAVAECLRKEGA